MMFSGEQDTDFIQQAVKAGVTAYLVDGVNPRHVKPVIEVAIAREGADHGPPEHRRAGAAMRLP